MNIFRIATKQAIREIISENASQNRFGFTVTDDNLELITERVVDLFEMTLNLRSRLSTATPASPAPEKRETPAAQPSRWQRASEEASSRTPTMSPRGTPPQEKVGFPKTRNAAEIYEGTLNVKKDPASETQLAPQYDLKLPRKRTALSAEEKEKLGTKW